jgi:putative ABC transport system permease protein
MTNQQARERLDLLVSGLARDRGDATPPTVVLDSASGFGVPPGVRRRLPALVGVLFGLAGLLIAVAAANVASLVLARGTRRVREMGVRLALGATRSQLVRQLLTESLLLALLGSAAGMLLSFWVTRALQPGVSAFEYVSYAVNITPDLRVFAYAAGGALATAAVFGVVPAFRATRTDLHEVLKPSGGAGRAPSTTRALRTLVVGQIAISTVLLMASGLLTRTYLNARAVDPGFDTSHLVSVSIDLNQLPLNADAGRRFFGALSANVSSIPGVDGISLTRETPLSPTGQDVPIWVDEVGASAPVSRRFSAGSMVVTPTHFALVGIPLVHGQLFARIDAKGALVAVINETMARRFWPSTSPLGKHFRLRDSLGARVEIIGVVKDVKYSSLTEEPRPVFYQPFTQQYSPRMTLLVRSRSAPYALMNAIREHMAALNPDLSAMQSRTLDEQLDRAIAPRRQSAFLLSIVGVIGLLLATIGLYGVISFGVRSRAREFGVRIALGATSRDVLLNVFGPGLRMVGIGLAVGVALSIGVARVFAGFLFGVAMHDPLTIGAVCGALAAVASLALYCPARWATGVEPTVALRDE